MSERMELTISGMHLRRFAPVVARQYPSALVGPATRWGHSQPAASRLRNLVHLRRLPRTADVAKTVAA
jgi:hypothetical protein